ncbi:MAG: hypothetical protein H0T42_10330, partial [Deltaproteobacteria bacterium]|nr:hypothetical protein [Deltaproteobacteria bacterium]
MRSVTLVAITALLVPVSAAADDGFGVVVESYTGPRPDHAGTVLAPV